MQTPKLPDITTDLQLPPHAAPPTALHKGALVLALLVAVTAGISVLLNPAAYSVLIALGIAASIGFLVACVRTPLLALYAALILTLLPAGLLPDLAHSILNRTLTLLATATWAFEVIRKKPRFIWSAASSLLLSFVLWAAVTLSWAENSEAGASEIVTYVLRLILFLILLPNQIRTQQALDGLFKALAICGWVLAPTAIVQVLLTGYAPGTRLALFGVNANELGTFLVVAMTGVLWQALKPTQTRKTLWYLAAGLYVAAAIAVIGMTGSRGSAISLLVTLAALWFWKSTRPWSKLGLSFILAGVLLFPSIFTTTVERFTGASGDTPLGGREVLWTEAWRLISDHPLIGVGVGNSGLEMRHEVMVGDRESVPIHNPVLVIWTDTGIVGLALYLGVLVSAIVLFCRIWKTHTAAGLSWLTPYFPLVGSVQLGHLLSWIKGGAAETGHTYFLMLSLLLIPASLAREEQRQQALRQSRSPYRANGGHPS